MQATSGRSARPERPLSPHIQIYYPLINMVMSIVHRITGVALYVGSLLLAWWLIAAATGPDYYNYVVSWFATWPGKLVLLGYTWALMHHMLGGIRHLIWDTGLRLRPENDRSPIVGHARRISDFDGAHLVRSIEPRGRLMVQMRTPLKTARQLGSAKEGADHFWKQRLTAVANIFLGLFLVWLIASLVGADYATVKRKLSNPLIALALLGLVVSGTLHMRLGMQAIIEDYVHSEGLKIAALMLNTFFAAFVALASIFAVLKLSFGA